MGRFLKVAAQPRRKRIVLTSSAPTVDVPTWARNGKGVVLVSGVGGGGAAGDQSTWGGGGAGAHALELPVPIPLNLAALAVTIGAGGAPVTGDNGGTGGATALSFAGIEVLRLGGGGGGAAGSNFGGDGGVPSMNFVQVAASLGTISNSAPVVMDLANVRQAAINIKIPCLGSGLSGYRGNPTNGALPGAVVCGNGAPSPFGSYHSNAWGYGYGGGQRGIAGGPGLLILEFVEGN